MIERFSIECRSKSNYSGQSQQTQKQSNEPIRIQTNTCNRHQARENACERDTIGFGFNSHWLRKWREFYQPITARSNARPKQNAITFDTQLKTALTPCSPYFDEFLFNLTFRQSFSGSSYCSYFQSFLVVFLGFFDRIHGNLMFILKMKISK